MLPTAEKADRCDDESTPRGGTPQRRVRGSEDEGDENASRPISRVLYGPCPQRQKRGGHSSWTHVAMRLTQPTRMTRLETAPKVALRAIPIRSCSRLGLPCRSCCQARGGLLPHPFTLTSLEPARRPVAEVVCFLWHFPWGRPRRPLAGTVFPGARTFLSRDLSVLAAAAARPAGSALKDDRQRKASLPRELRRCRACASPWRSKPPRSDSCGLPRGRHCISGSCRRWCRRPDRAP